MKKKRINKTKNVAANQSGTPPDDEAGVKEKKVLFTTKRVETLVAILLGITTLLSAWASWIGHLHGGLQSINFTESNNVASEGTAEYNLGMQAYLADYMAWNTLNDYYYDLKEAESSGDQEKMKIITEKIDNFKKQNISKTLSEAIEWMEENNKDSPFMMPDMPDIYFESAQDTIMESRKLLEEGKRDNAKGDSYMLVTVIYSLTLFLLGIIGTFKDIPNKLTLLCVAVVCLVVAFVYMSIIPMPTGFDNMNFFSFNK